MDGITIGTILRESPKPGDEVCELLKAASMNHILFPVRNATARVSRWGKNTLVSNGTKKLHGFALEHSTRISAFIPANSREIPGIRTDTVFVEVDPSRENDFDLTKAFVSKILAERPDTKIGVVAPLQTWLGGWEGELRNILSPNVFACPIIGDGIHSLETLLTGATRLPAGTIPFVFSISVDDKSKFSEILGRFSASFAEVILWNPRVVRGVDFTKKEVPMSDTVKVTITNLLVDQYVALQPVAKRVEPSRSSLVKGTVEVGDTYIISKTQPGAMGETFGLLSDVNLWVMLSDEKFRYFEKVS